MLNAYEIKTKTTVTDTSNGKTYKKKYSTVALYFSAEQGRPTSFEVKGEDILNFLYQDNEIGERLKRTIWIKVYKHWKNKGRQEVHTIGCVGDDDEELTCWLEDCVIQFERTVEKTSLTLKEMMETFKADEVIEYCVERGLNFLPQ